MGGGVLGRREGCLENHTGRPLDERLVLCSCSLTTGSLCPPVHSPSLWLGGSQGSQEASSSRNRVPEAVLSPPHLAQGSLVCPPGSGPCGSSQWHSSFHYRQLFLPSPSLSFTFLFSLCFRPEQALGCAQGVRET